MMSPLSSLVAATSGVYLFVALSYAGLWTLRREAREFGAFAVLAASLAGVALATARLVDARSLAEAAAGQRVQVCAIVLGIGSFVVFCVHVSGSDLPRLRRAAMLYAGVGFALCAAFLFFDPSVPAPASIANPSGRRIAALSTLGVAVILLGLLLALIAFLHLVRAARRDPSLRLTAIGACLPLAGGAGDVAMHLSGLGAFELSSLAPLLAVAIIGWALVGRFARIDAELETRTRELATSYDSLRQMQEELVRTEQLAAVGELSAVIAHEVRNPLAIIRNAVSGLRRDELAPDDAETLLAILDEEADRLNRLVLDLLAYARPVALDPKYVKVVELVRHAVELAKGGHAERRNIVFDVDTSPDPGPVHGDPALLRHALINIVDNAIQAMPEGGTVTIRCREADLDGRAALALDCQDEGEGMDTLVRSRARDPFFTTRQTGTGLGLAIVERVARVHGGRVEITSRHGQGTTVTLVLPRERVSTAPPSTFG